MAYDVQKLLDIALNEVGYLEKETYDQLDEKTANAGDENYTKYQRDLAKLSYFNGSKKGIAWCAVFVCWCFAQAFGKSAALKLLCQPSSGNCGAGCNSQMNYYKKKKQFYTSDPRPGDQIIFWSSSKTEASHTGLVYKVDHTYVYTVEGNTSSSSGVVANGGAVAKKKYKLTYDRIAGYGRPDYGEAPVVDNEPQVEPSETPVCNAKVNVKKGSTVNYRTSPNIKAPQVSGMPRIKKGEEVYVKTSDGTWAAVEYKGYKGYIMAEFLVYNDTADTKEDVVENTGIVDRTMFINGSNGIGANYRQRPDASAPYVVGATYIPNGESVYVKTTDGTWAAVEYKTYRGYILAKELVQEAVVPDVQKPTQRTYTTVKGDTLWKIASVHLGSGLKYKKIMQANGMKNTIVRPGMVLKIPEA